jgi:dTDP-4-amino-4,6-dideoxygalactose transaminase
LAGFHAADEQGREPLPWFIASGTAALMALLLGHGIGPGDEVITTALTWAAPTSAILAVGATPVFADIEETSGLIDPAAVPDLVSERTRAILVVHLFGSVCDMVALRDIADQHQLLLFEDGSQAHGAMCQGRQVGDWGDGAAFSCMGLKLLAGTEGGYAVFRDRAALEVAYLYGRHPRGLPDDMNERLATAGLLDSLQLGWRPSSVCALLVQRHLHFLRDEIAARRRNAAYLRSLLAQDGFWTLPPERDGDAHAYHLLSLLAPEPLTTPQRDAAIAVLQAGGVTAFHYLPAPIPGLAKMDMTVDEPPLFWRQPLRQAGFQPERYPCPITRRRLSRSLEAVFNWYEDDRPAMEAIAGHLRRAAAAIQAIAS